MKRQTHCHKAYRSRHCGIDHNPGKRRTTGCNHKAAQRAEKNIIRCSEDRNKKQETTKNQRAGNVWTQKKDSAESLSFVNLKSNTMKNTHANIEIIYDTRKFFLAKDLAVQFN